MTHYTSSLFFFLGYNNTVSLKDALLDGTIHGKKKLLRESFFFEEQYSKVRVKLEYNAKNNNICAGAKHFTTPIIV